MPSNPGEDVFDSQRPFIQTEMFETEVFKSTTAQDFTRISSSEHRPINLRYVSQLFSVHCQEFCEFLGFPLPLGSEGQEHLWN
jgi:hypothetical protein